MGQIMPFSAVRANFKQVLDHVCADHAPVIVTRPSGESVVMLSESDYASLQETLYLLSSRANADRLFESMAQIERQQVHHVEFPVRG